MRARGEGGGISGRTLRLAGALAATAALVGLVLLVRLNRRVNQALEADVSHERPVERIALPESPGLPFWGGEDIEAVAALPGGLYVAGAFGVARLEPTPDSRALGFDRIDVSRSLPTRRASTMSAWRTDLVVGLEAGGLFVYRAGAWSEVRSGFGSLHVRDLAETPAGELWMAAREGLFRMRWAEGAMARLHPRSVRSLAVAEGGRVISGGEDGLFVTEGATTSTSRLEGADTPWIEGVALFGPRIVAATPTGLLAEGDDRVFRPLAGGANLVRIASQGGRLYAAADPPDGFVRNFDVARRLQVEQMPSAVRRVFSVGDRLFADTANGLVERTKEGWRILSPRLQPGSFGQAHVGGLAWFHDRLIVGFFDGGLAELIPRPSPPGGDPASEASLTLHPITGPSSSIWAVNALLEAGGALHVASLRGAFRFDGSSVTPLEGPGAAFSLARTRGGVAIGFGEGVLLPEQKLLSAFHGLPGNQATALAAMDNGLLVGTPSGLGYVEGGRVRFRVASGEGRLPHPWVNAILPVGDSVLIGTYGGGLVRRKGSMSGPGDWTPFPETEGLKVNAGCLIEAGGRVYAGTDGAGLWRLSVDGSRFDRLKLPLPSPRVTALLARDGFLYLGTDEGLTRWSSEGDAQR